MASSGYKSVSATTWDTLKFSWEIASQSIANNTSTVNWKMELIASTYGRIDAGGESNWSITVNGTNYSGKKNIAISNNSSKILASGSTTISHSADGSKSFNYSFSQVFNITFDGDFIGTVSGSGSGTLDTIPRAANIVSAPNFNDEDNPKITYSNSAGSAITTLRACISLDGSKDDVAYRDISKTGTSYTFNLTEAERNVLRKATADSNSRTVRFYVMSVIGGETYRKSLEKTFSIINAAPVLAPTAIDNGSVSKVLTGDASGTVIKGYNSMNVAANATAQKQATITSYKITCGGKSITTASGTLSRVEQPTFQFTVTDSRGNKTTKIITKDFIDYVKLTCNLAANAPTTDGVMSFTVSGNYFSGSFGAVSNSLTVQYRMKTESGAYGAWQTLAATVSGNTYKVTQTLSGLDYQTNYTIQARALDAIYNGDTEPVVETAEKRVKTLPLFDWDADSFAFHVPIFMDNTKQIWHKDTSGNNVLMVSLNASNQAFFGYGTYDAGLGSTYFDGNSVYIRSKNNISNTASGTIGGNKSWTNSSDSRLKEDIRDIPQVFCDIWLELSPKVFRWNELNSGDNTLQLGLIAQDVIEVFGKHGLDYKNYGFVSTMPVNGVDYFAITYEHYNMLTAQVLKNTIAEVSSIKAELAAIKLSIAN